MAVEVHEQEEKGDSSKVSNDPGIKFSSARNAHHVDDNKGNGRTHVNHKLQDLQGSQILLPPRALSESIDGKVIIHNNMNGSVVEGCDPTHVDTCVNRHPRDGDNDRVVEEMKDSQLLLTKDQEHGIKEFVVLG